MNIKKMVKQNSALRVFTKQYHVPRELIYVLASNKKYRHIKSGKEYQVFGDLKNATNSSDWEDMVLYTNGEQVFAREKSEFKEKFEEIKE
jgi:hypothetical protein